MPEVLIKEKVDDNMQDLLARQPFVDTLIDITERLAKNKKSTCYAINGSWGVGKSFIIDMFTKQLSEKQQKGVIADKYLIFSYNCWKYDYYEEPIIAIVASMLDEIDKNVNLLPLNSREKIKGLLKAIGGGLLLKFNDAIEDKTGINIKDLVKTIKEGNEEAAKEIEQSHHYDPYFSFKNILNRLQETIGSLSENQTIVFVVDELDRCLPEYMIKVLERLHHIFTGVSNVQVVLSIDKEQIYHTVTSIYGRGTEVDKYLAKFIDFEIDLDEGNLSNQYAERYAYYFNKFEYICAATIDDDVQEFRINILNGIDMRGKIEIINKCNMLHDMILGDDKKDLSFMCVELFLAVMKYWKIIIPVSSPFLNIGNLFEYERKGNNTGLDYLETKLGEVDEFLEFIYVNDRGNVYIRRSDIWGVLLVSARVISGKINDGMKYDKYQNLGLRQYAIDFWNLLQIIN